MANPRHHNLSLGYHLPRRAWVSVRSPVVIAPASGMLAGLFGRRSPGAGALATMDGLSGLPDELISALETRAIWGRYGF